MSLPKRVKARLACSSSVCSLGLPAAAHCARRARRDVRPSPPKQAKRRPHGARCRQAGDVGRRKWLPLALPVATL